MGCYPTVYTIQVIYYTFCIFVLVLGIAYMTSSVVVFFRDLTQVINIALQVGVWMTPIMWVDGRISALTGHPCVHR